MRDLTQQELLTEQQNVIDFDVETTGLQPHGEGNEAFLWIFGDPEGRNVAIPFRASGKPLPSWGITEENADRIYAENWLRIQRWFDRANEQGIRAWNAKFDRAFADAAGVFEVPGDGKWHDGMIVAHAIDERRSVALKAVADNLFPGASDPQKLLKEWLTTENARRSKLLKDADKARVGKLKVPNEKAGEPYEKGDPLPGGLVATRKGKQLKLRPATEEEIEAVIAEAALYDAGEEGYIRANYSHVPKSIMYPYAIDDVVLTRRVVEHYLVTLMNKPDLLHVVEFERGTMDALYALETRGLPVKAGGVEYRKLEQEVIRNLDPLYENCIELAKQGDPLVYGKQLAGSNWGPGKKFIEVGEDGKYKSFQGGVAMLDTFNPSSTPQIIAALMARGADLSHMTKKNNDDQDVPFYKGNRTDRDGNRIESEGRYSADAANLRAVDDELAAAILKFKAENQVLTTYVRPMIGRSYVPGMNVYKEPFIAPDNRIHANYRQVGARTGRMSCSDPNMQNQPRDDLRLRYNIVAEPGYKLVTCDLTNIEMFLFAAYCGSLVDDSKLLAEVEKGFPDPETGERGDVDLHSLTARMLGLRDRSRPGGGYESARQQGKTYNFSRIYGGGLRTIRKSLRVDNDTAKLYKQRFDNAYPEVGMLTNRIETRLRDWGYIQDKHVSKRYFRVDTKDAYKATNYLVQGTAASLLKYAVTKLHEDGVPMVALVHDEIVAHVPEEDAERVAKLIEKRMTEHPSFDGVVPLMAEADIVDRWSDAKKLKDEHGREYYFDPEWANAERRYVNEVA